VEEKNCVLQKIAHLGRAERSKSARDNLKEGDGVRDFTMPYEEKKWHIRGRGRGVYLLGMPQLTGATWSQIDPRSKDQP